MIHLGDITKINGAEIPKVDVITGGSPCQDLSVAGKRAGAKAVWASEIEEFCIAVTKLRFSEGDEPSEQNDKLHSTP